MSKQLPAATSPSILNILFQLTPNESIVWQRTILHERHILLKLAFDKIINWYLKNANIVSF